MGLSKEKIEKIECMTWDLLIDVYAEDKIIPPIDLNLIVEKAGLSIRQGVFDNSDIAGAYDKEGKIIYLNENDSYFRKAFTVGHELGHFYLHDDKPLETFFRLDMQRIEEEDRVMEQEANWFAASLLMPRSVVMSLWRATKDLNEVSRRCAVSSLAAHFRLKNLGLLD